jgi:hypothetical protein
MLLVGRRKKMPRSSMIRNSILAMLTVTNCSHDVEVLGFSVASKTHLTRRTTYSVATPTPIIHCRTKHALLSSSTASLSSDDDDNDHHAPRGGTIIETVSFWPSMDALDRRLIKIALPCIANFAINPLIGAVDLFWVNRMGNSLAVAGQAAANQIFSSAFWLASFLPSG